MSIQYSRVEVRTHRIHGAPRGVVIDPKDSPYLIAVNSVGWARDVARGWREVFPVDTFRAADDGFGNLLRVSR